MDSVFGPNHAECVALVWLTHSMILTLRPSLCYKVYRVTLSHMKSGWNISKLGKGRLVRVVAFLFLFHTGVDLLFPQLCSEEPFNITVNQSLFGSRETVSDETSAIVTASLPYESQEEQRPDQPREEDCFCCCTHVMASRGFVNPQNAELKVLASSPQDISVPSAPINNPYHPPRFA